MDSYVIKSLELHLFFCRIMKEHSFFMEVGFTGAAVDCSKEAKWYKEAFEDLLCDVVSLSDGIIGIEQFNAREFVTEYTLESEEKTACLTGADIDIGITEKEIHIWKCEDKRIHDCCIENRIKEINERAIELVTGLIRFKKWVLEQVLNCNLFTINYPLLLEHIIREAELYLRYIKNLECGSSKEQESIKDVELFWDQIMMEHALFIRGLLDPTEGKLINTANDFANSYGKLINEARNMTQRTMRSVTNETIMQTMKYKDFKTAGVKGINDCSIRSLILPLLADHVLREANHYLNILR